jgi:hypothetical protein
VNSSGIPYSIPLWAFIAVVCLPIIGAIFAEILIWWKNKNRY